MIITERTRNIVGWIFASLVVLMMLASAADKIIGSEHALQMGGSFGLSKEVYRALGIIEAASALLFLFPRTGLLGTLLLASYLGGAMATHLQHQLSIFFPAAIETFVCLTAIIRYPEVTERILSKRVSN